MPLKELTDFTYRKYSIGFGIIFFIFSILYFSVPFVYSNNLEEEFKGKKGVTNNLITPQNNIEADQSSRYYQFCPLITELSSNVVPVSSKDNERSIKIFGSKNCPKGKIVFIVSGIPESITIRTNHPKVDGNISKLVGIKQRAERYKKSVISKIANIKNKKLISSIPSLYLLQTKHRIKDLSNYSQLHRLSIGLDNLDINIKETKSLSQFYDIMQEGIKYQVKKGLFMQSQGDHTNVLEGKSLFKSAFVLPRLIKPCNYIVQTVVFLNGNINNINIDPFRISQTKIGSVIDEMSRYDKKTYTIVLICFSASIGMISFFIIDMISQARVNRKYRNKL